jgi:DNA-binding NarL/FixJ family response regulator
MNIIVADRQDRVRFALRILLERMLGQKVMGEASNASELSSLAARTNPDILVLEWELPGLDAAAGLQELLQLHPMLMVIVTSSASGARQAALDAGADAFVNKAAPPEALLEAVSACLRSTVDRRAGINQQ